MSRDPITRIYCDSGTFHPFTLLHLHRCDRCSKQIIEVVLMVSVMVFNATFNTI